MPSFSGNVVDNRITLNVFVGPPHPPPTSEPESESAGNGHAPPANRTYRAILDTGAVVSGISSKVVEELGLQTGEWTIVRSVNSPSTAPLYKVSLAIPIAEGPHAAFAKGVPEIEVAELSLDPDIDVLLGMDFLQGFHLTLFRNLFILSN